MDVDAGLHIGGSGKGLGALDRDWRVAPDQRRGDTAQCFNAERQWRNIKQQNIFNARVARQNSALNSRADCDDFIRIQTLVRLFLEQIFYNLLNLRNSYRTLPG